MRWLDSLDAWIQDGITILGGSHEAGSPAWGPPGVSGARWHLSKGWPAVTPENAAEDGGRAFGKWVAIAGALLRARVIAEMPPDPRVDRDLRSPDQLQELRAATGTFEATERLLDTMLECLGALRGLSEGARANAAGLQTHPGPDGARRILMRGLAYSFEELHGRDYTVVVPNPRTHGSVPPEGAALAWTRALFRLIADRVESMPAEIVDKHNEFRELAAWGDKPHAAAELIQPVAQWEKPRGKRRARRP